MSAQNAQSVLFPEGWELKRQRIRLMGCGAIGIHLCKCSCQRLILHLAVLSIHAKLKTKWSLAKPQHLLILPWLSLSGLLHMEFLVSVEGWRFAYVQCDGLDEKKTYERGFVLFAKEDSCFTDVLENTHHLLMVVLFSLETSVLQCWEQAQAHPYGYMLLFWSHESHDSQWVIMGWRWLGTISVQNILRPLYGYLEKSSFYNSHQNSCDVITMWCGALEWCSVQKITIVK